MPDQIEKISVWKALKNSNGEKTVLPSNCDFSKNKRSDLPLAKKINSHPWPTIKMIYRQSLKQARNQSSKSLNIKPDQRFKHPAMKTTLNYEEGPKIQKFGEKSCSCNNWQLPGEPRSLDDYSLSDKLFNNKWTYWILPAIWIYQMENVCIFNHWW